MTIPMVISKDLLKHLKKDHPIEAVIAEKMIARGEWILEEPKPLKPVQVPKKVFDGLAPETRHYILDRAKAGEAIMEDYP